MTSLLKSRPFDRSNQFAFRPTNVCNGAPDSPVFIVSALLGACPPDPRISGDAGVDSPFGVWARVTSKNDILTVGRPLCIVVTDRPRRTSFPNLNV